MKIKFPYDKQKAENAALWLLQRHGGTLDILKLIKLVFYADKLHLERYGRPITGGKYVAMPHGPVSSSLYQEINEDTANGLARREYKVSATKNVDEDFLSESDLEVLSEINEKYGKMDQYHLRDLSHKLEAYRKNWKDNEPRKSFDLPYEDFFLDDLNAAPMLDIIREDGEARAFFV